MGALAFKPPHYSQGSELESVCCLNIQILTLVLFAGFQGVVKSTGLSPHQQASPMERVSIKGSYKDGLLKVPTGKQFNHPGFEKSML